MRTDHKCPKCGWGMYEMDAVEINGNEVQFLGCISCCTGYTRWEDQLELIS